MSEIVRFSNDEQLFALAERLYADVESKLLRLLPQADVRHVGGWADTFHVWLRQLMHEYRAAKSEFIAERLRV